jgi:hypothetical protein
MANSVNINDCNFMIISDKKNLAPPKQLKNEITKFNKKLSDKKKLNQILTKDNIDKNLVINTSNTQRLSYNRTISAFSNQISPPNILTILSHYSSNNNNPIIIKQNSNDHDLDKR